VASCAEAGKDDEPGLLNVVRLSMAVMIDQINIDKKRK
jgi:hypothetical protein